MDHRTLEPYVYGLCGALAIAVPRFTRRVLVQALRLAGRLGRAPRVWIALSALLGFGVPYLGAHHVRWPQPSIHDEFAYLMMAETFALGRLSMPTHPHWEHFETFHVIQHPTYAAKYPPAVALPFTAGIVLFGQPRMGLWLQSAALAAALAWMLFGWLPPRLAVVGTALGLARFCVAGPWVQTFYNGAVAGTGGALVLGVLGRLVLARHGVRGRVGHGLVLGLGLALLAASRPFEGLMLALAACACLVFTAWRRVRAGRGREVARVAVPVVAILALGLGAQLVYNAGVTGDPLRMPYAENDDQYAVYPPFLWQDVAPEREFRHADLREFALGFQRGDYGAWGDAAALTSLAANRAWRLARDLTGWPLFLLCAAALLRPRRRGFALLAALWLTVFLALCTTSYLEPRYTAPAVAAVVCVAALGFDALRRLRPRWLGAPLAVASVAGVAVFAGVTWRDFRAADISWFGEVRAERYAWLLAQPGEDLVFVRCTEDHSLHHMWVVNGAEIDAQPVVWARDLGADANARLIAHYPGRLLWRLTSGDLHRGELSIEPYER